MTEPPKNDELLLQLVAAQRDCIDSLKLVNKFMEERLTVVVERYKQLEEQAVALQKQYNALVATKTSDTAENM